MIKLKKLTNDQFYAIDYKTGYIVAINEKDLKETYIVAKPKVEFYCTIKNKILIDKHIEETEEIRYHKLYKCGELATELEIGDIVIVKDKEDTIYKVCIDINGDIFGKVIGYSDTFNLDTLFNDYEGDDDYDCEID